MLRHILFACFAISISVSAAWSQTVEEKPGATDKKILLKANGELTAQDPLAKGAYYKIHEVKLEAGTLYKYPLVFSWKGAITGRQCIIKQALGESSLAPLARDLQQIATQLARESFATPEPKNRDPWLQIIEKLTGDKETLERKLASQSKAFAKRGARQKRCRTCRVGPNGADRESLQAVARGNEE